MKVLAPFDRTPFAETTLPLLERIAAMPAAEFVLLAVAQEPHGRLQRGARRSVIAGEVLGSVVPLLIESPEADYAETKQQAFERKLAELDDYLTSLANRLPKGTHVTVEAHLADDAAAVIIDRARAEGPDIIVMATHSRTGLSHVLFGSTTETVVRSGVAPVLVVHPKGD